MILLRGNHRLKVSLPLILRPRCSAVRLVIVPLYIPREESSRVVGFFDKEGWAWVRWGVVVVVVILIREHGLNARGFSRTHPCELPMRGVHHLIDILFFVRPHHKAHQLSHCLFPL